MVAIKRYEARGWKEICALTGYRSIKGAKKHVIRLGLLCHDGRSPVVSIEAYRIAVFNRHRQEDPTRPKEED